MVIPGGNTKRRRVFVGSGRITAGSRSRAPSTGCPSEESVAPASHPPGDSAWASRSAAKASPRRAPAGPGPDGPPRHSGDRPRIRDADPPCRREDPPAFGRRTRARGDQGACCGGGAASSSGSPSPPSHWTGKRPARPPAARPPRDAGRSSPVPGPRSATPGRRMSAGGRQGPPPGPAKARPCSPPGSGVPVRCRASRGAPGSPWPRA
jgi:hypothetical protein